MLKPDIRLELSVLPYMWFLQEQSQFSVDQTAQSLTCSIREKPHTGLENATVML